MVTISVFVLQKACRICVKTTISMFLASLLMLILAPLNAPGDAGAVPRSSRIFERGLLEKYSPVFYFHPDEKFYPWGINSMMDNADLKRLEDNLEAPMPIVIEDLVSHDRDNFYMDLRDLVPYHDAVNISSDTEKTYGGLPFKVYGRLVKPRKHPDHFALQYWLFYPFNDWHNDHEGDWEMLQIRYSIKRNRPDQLTTSHHHSGTVLPWSKVGKFDGTHPKIFVAKGGHGNWLTSGDHVVGKIWSKIGIFKDKTSADGLILYPEHEEVEAGGRSQRYELLDISDESPSSWPYWDGKWGDAKGSYWGSRGPESPGMQDKWENPIDWGNKPAKSSVWAYLGSPGHMHIYDSHGNHVGLTSEAEKLGIVEVEGNIPGTYFYVPASHEVSEDCAWINTSEDLRLEIVATSSGRFNLSFDLDVPLGEEEKILMGVRFEDVEMAIGGTAAVEVEMAKLTEKITTSLAESSAGKRGSDEADLESAEAELEEIIREARLSSKLPRKDAAERMEEELAELEDTLRKSSMERSAKKRDSALSRRELAELELENMIEIVKLSKKLAEREIYDRVDRELAELEDTIKGVGKLESLLKPLLIMKIDSDGDGTVDKSLQPDKILGLEF